VLGSLLWPERVTEDEEEVAGRAERAAAQPSFPVPPMDLAVPPSPRIPVTVGRVAEPSQPIEGRESPDA
jgi:hypothetical protein